MRFETITDPDDIEEGDQILVKDKEGRIRFFDVQIIKEVDNDFEIILNKRNNVFYRDSEFVRGSSWAKEIVKIKP